MMLKIDLEKAFDRLEWSFIQSSLNALNFPVDLITLIMNCISTTSTSIIANGKPMELFESSRGIRQGDSLYPYLCIIFMQSLTRWIDHAVDTCNWKPIKIIQSGPLISHLLLAYDHILFFEADATNAISIIDIFNFITWQLGQHSNFSKLKILFTKNVHLQTQNTLSTMLNIKATTHVGKYLGFCITNFQPKILIVNLS